MDGCLYLSEWTNVTFDKHDKPSVNDLCNKHRNKQTSLSHNHNHIKIFTPSSFYSVLMLLTTEISCTRVICGVKIPDIGIREPQGSYISKDEATSGIRCRPEIGPSWTEPKIDIKAERTGLKQQPTANCFRSDHLTGF